MVEIDFLILFSEEDTMIYCAIGMDYNSCVDEVYNTFSPGINFIPVQIRRYDRISGELIEVTNC